jgi:hypothetical protein
MQAILLDNDGKVAAGYYSPLGTIVIVYSYTGKLLNILMQ